MDARGMKIMFFYVLRGCIDQTITMDNHDAFAKSLGFSSSESPLFDKLIFRMWDNGYIGVDEELYDVWPSAVEEFAEFAPQVGLTDYRPEELAKWRHFIQEAEQVFNFRQSQRSQPKQK